MKGHVAGSADKVAGVLATWDEHTKVHFPPYIIFNTSVVCRSSEILWRPRPLRSRRDRKSSNQRSSSSTRRSSKYAPTLPDPGFPKFDRAAYTNYPQATEDAEHSEGFWREFFLLPPDGRQLHALLDKLSPDETLGLQVSFLSHRATPHVRRTDFD